MRILLLYHFFHPDVVISARLFSDLAVELTKAGHHVTVFACNRLIRGGDVLPPLEDWNGIDIHRFVRPHMPQNRCWGRLFNSIFLQMKWLKYYFKTRQQYDVVIVGTDPQFSHLMFPWLRLMNRKVKLIHWVFDLYPEALCANSRFWMKIPGILFKPIAWFCYQFMDEMVDIGCCMRKRLIKYHSPAHCSTLTPWALVQPKTIPAPDPEIREKLFGKAKLGILYSGTVGYAHDIIPFIELARKCRTEGLDIGFCFAGYGNRYQEQTAQITDEDTNIRLAGFTSETELEKRLAAADIHMVSLRKGWEGIVVPSKFFGSLAIGRPVLFSGPDESCIAQWCYEYAVGTVLYEDTVKYLKMLLENKDALSNFQRRAYQVYHEHFSRNIIIAEWLKLLADMDRN